MNILKKLGLLSILSITCCFSVLEATKITSTLSQEDEGTLIKLLRTRTENAENDIINFISSKNLNPNYEFKFDELTKGKKLIFFGISRPKLLKYLIEKVADKNIIWKDKAYNYDGNLLHHTINQNANNHKLPEALDCIKILVESKVDIDAKNSDGDSPLALAVQRYYNYYKQGISLTDEDRNILFDIIKYLTNNGANIDVEVSAPFSTNISDRKKLSDHIINGKKFFLGSTNKEFDKKIIDLFKQLKEKNNNKFSPEEAKHTKQNENDKSDLDKLLKIISLNEEIDEIKSNYREMAIQTYPGETFAQASERKNKKMANEIEPINKKIQILKNELKNTPLLKEYEKPNKSVNNELGGLDKLLRIINLNSKIGHIKYKNSEKSFGKYGETMQQGRERLEKEKANEIEPINKEIQKLKNELKNTPLQRYVILVD